LKPRGAYGAVEAGGTKWVCAVGNGPDDLRAETRFPTTTPAETITRALTFFQEFQHTDSLKAIGVGSFGPIDLDPGSSTYGSITSTPKPGWAYTDVVGILQQALGVPVAFDTDVNAAGLGEYRWGAGQDCASMVYLTIGTGVGGGVLIEGRPLHGLIHPEMGHMRVPHDWQRDPFPGNCSYHSDCLEGLASGPALAQRWGQPAETLPADHPAWALQAHYLALALVNLICTLSPQRIVIGGGVMAQPQLFALVRADVQQLLNGYVQAPAILEHIEGYIMPPALGGRAGILGAIALAAHSVAG
jgi:fructokinase